MLSIAICTFNRVEQLVLLLDQLCLMHEWLEENTEILIIDNNSTDKTIDLIQPFSKLLPLHVFKETQQGLAHARNKAIVEFKGEALLFFDDDITVSLETLESYLQALQVYSDASFFGGKIYVDWQGDVPIWLKSDDLVLLNGLFGQYDLGNLDIVYGDNHMLPFGANFMLRRSLIEQVGIFDTRLGVIGNAIGRGEETDYFNRAQKKELTGMYIAGAPVGHRFQKERINLVYLYRYGIEKGRSEVLVSNRSSNKNCVTVMLNSLFFILRGIFQLMKFRRDRFYQCIINTGIEYGFWSETKKRKVNYD